MKNTMNPRLLISAAALACIAASVSAQSNVIDFDTYPTGNLDVGVDSPWSKSGAGSAVIESLPGGNALHLQGEAAPAPCIWTQAMLD